MDITQSEEEILTACTDCGFGELKDVELEEGIKKHIDLVEEQRKFIRLLRDNAVLFASKILVHNGFPTQLETDGVSGKIKYRRKLRI